MIAADLAEEIEAMLWRAGVQSSDISDILGLTRKYADTVTGEELDRRRRRQLLADIANGAVQGRNRPAKCGTESGYRRHRNEGTEPCIECLSARSLAARARYARRKAATT